MMLISFRSRLTPQAGKDYEAMSDEMDRLARASPGFIDVKAFTAADGERLTLVWWESADTLRQWAENVRHLMAQRMGRERWYEYYINEVAEVVRTSRFQRD
jgi:heme-degrading monooxygenase HmoA